MVQAVAVNHVATARPPRFDHAAVLAILHQRTDVVMVNAIVAGVQEIIMVGPRYRRAVIG